MRLLWLLLISLIGFIISSCSSKKEVFVRVHSPAPYQTAESKIYIAGNFNDWKPDDPTCQLKYISDGVFEGKFVLPKELKRIEYKYTRGDWASAETSVGGHPIENRIVAANVLPILLEDTIAYWSAALPSHTARPNVRLLHDTFHIPQLDRQRRIWVYLPTGYEESEDKRYPVIYMHDGQNLFDERFAPFGEWQVDETLNEMEKEFGHSSIVVGIEHGDKTRIAEYSPYVHPKHGGGEGKRYLDFIINTLKPYIDREYRTLANREHTAIGGASLGGLISFCAGVYHPETFGNLLAFSPSFWFSEEAYEDAQKLLKSPDMRIFMSVGKKEVSLMSHGVEKVEAILRKDIRYAKSGEQMKVIYFEEGEHNEHSWRTQFPQAYQWIFELE